MILLTILTVFAATFAGYAISLVVTKPVQKDQPAMKLPLIVEAKLEMQENL